MDLQNHIVEDVVAEKITEHDGGGLNTLEVRGLLREFPSTEMAFIFPASDSIRACTPRPISAWLPAQTWCCW